MNWTPGQIKELKDYWDSLNGHMVQRVRDIRAQLRHDLRHRKRALLKGRWSPKFGRGRR